MFRLAHVLLTIAGILVCPFVCASGGWPGGCPDRCCEQSSVRTCCDDREDGGCESDEPAGNPAPLPGSCKTHPCICSGALQNRYDASPDAGVWMHAAALDQALLAAPRLVAVGPAARIGESPPFPPLPTGHAIRLALESLLL